MEREKLYSLWKSEPFPVNMEVNAVLNKIQELIFGLNRHYGLVNQPTEAMESIFEFCLVFIKKFQRFKLIDMDRAFELYKHQPELNKITPAYFEKCFDLYKKSEERNWILKRFNDEQDSLIPEVLESTTKEQRLKDCFAHWKFTGEIRLNSGLVYEENFKAIKEAFGMDELQMIAEYAKANFIEKLEVIRETIMKMADHHELQARIDSAIKGGPEVKNVIRKAHLKAYFEMMEKQLA